MLVRRLWVFLAIIIVLSTFVYATPATQLIVVDSQDNDFTGQYFVVAEDGFIQQSDTNVHSGYYDRNNNAGCKARWMFHPNATDNYKICFTQNTSNSAGYFSQQLRMENNTITWQWIDDGSDNDAHWSCSEAFAVVGNKTYVWNQTSIRGDRCAIDAALMTNNMTLVGTLNTTAPWDGNANIKDEDYWRPAVAANTPPTFSNAINSSSVKINQVWTANISIADDTGLSKSIFSTNISSSWYNDTPINLSSKTSYRLNSTSFNSLPRNKKICWKVFANDTNSAWSSSSMYCILTENTLPTFTQALTTHTTYIGNSLSYDINCSDADSDTILYYDNTSLFNINSSTGIITDTPTAGEVGTYPIKITCADPIGNVTSTFNYVILNPTPPVWSLNWTNATTPTYLGETVTFGVKWTDDVDLNNTFKFYTNATVTASYSEVIVAGTSYYYNKTIKLRKVPGNHTYVYNFTAFDNLGAKNSTPNWYFKVTDRKPWFSSFGSNYTAPPYYGGGIRMYDYWNDDSNLTWSYGYFQLYNTTHRIINSTPKKYGTSNFDVGGWSGDYFRYDVVITQPGVYYWNTCINDSANQWCYPKINHTFTITGTNPQWYGVGSNATNDTIKLGGGVTLFSNWTVASGILSKFQLRERLPNGTWINNSAYQAFNCTSYTNCAATVTSYGTMSPTGNHTFVFIANSSFGGWNQTAGFVVVMPPPPSFFNYPGNATYLGSDDFLDGNGFTTFTERGQKNLQVREYPPLVKDLDGNGYYEIIIRNNRTLRFYERNVLTLRNEVNLYGTGSYSNIVSVVNWSIADKQTMFLISENMHNAQLNIVTYNTSSSVINLSINITSWLRGYRGGQIALGCGNQTCLIVYNTLNYSGFNGVTLNTSSNTSMVMFNRLYNYSPSQILYMSKNTSCFPKYRDIPLVDYDNDGTSEFVVPLITINRNNNDEKAIIFFVNVSNQTLKVESNLNNSEFGNPVLVIGSPDDKIYCYYKASSGYNHSDVGRIMTNPLVYDADNNLTDGMETIIGVFTGDYNTQKDDYDFNLYEMNAKAGVWTAYTHAGNDGIPGNLFRASTFDFPGNRDVDFCAFGYRNTGLEGGLLCGSVWNETPDDNYFSLDGVTDMPYSYTDFSSMVYAGQFEPSNLWNPRSEIVFQKGIYYLDFGWWGDKLLPSWTSDYGQADVTPIPDPVSGGYSDLVLTQPGYIYYLDDGAIDGWANLNNWTVNPCIIKDGARVSWNEGTDIRFTISINDTNTLVPSDFISVKVTLYNVSDNATAPQITSGWSTYKSSGTIFKINFTNKLNWTTSNSTFRIDYRDWGNYTTKSHSEIFSVVELGGVVYGECVTSNGYVISTPPSASTNEIISAFDKLRTFSNLSKYIFWMIVMVATVYAIWVPGGGSKSPKTSIMVTIAALIFEVIVGKFIGFVNTGMFFITIIILIIIALISAKKVIFDG